MPALLDDSLVIVLAGGAGPKVVIADVRTNPKMGRVRVGQYDAVIGQAVTRVADLSRHYVQRSLRGG